MTAASKTQTIWLFLQCWFCNIQCHFSSALFQPLKQGRHEFGEDPILGPNSEVAAAKGLGPGIGTMQQENGKCQDSSSGKHEL